MGKTVRSNRGFSLVEMMIALVIMSISFLALSAVMVSAISVNLETELRNASLRLTSQTAEALLALPVDRITTCGITTDASAPNYNSAYTYDNANECLGGEDDYKKYPDPNQSIRGVRQSFNITWNTTNLSGNTAQIIISVAYHNNRGEDHINNAVIYKHSTL